jgi:hypothetical protein
LFLGVASAAIAGLVLMGLYDSLEGAYYSLMDKLEFLRVYEWFVNPIESRGIPSFPVAVLLLVAIIAGAWLYTGGFGFALPSPAGKEWRVNVVGAGGESLPDVLVTVTLGGKDYSAHTNDKGVALFKDLPAGKKGEVKVAAEGYEAYSREFDSSELQFTIRLSSAATPAPEEKQISVNVRNSGDEPLGGALIVYADPSTGETVRLTTDATGSTQIPFVSEEDFFNIRVTLDGFVAERKTCFASNPTCAVTLKTEAGFCTDPDCETPGGGGTQEEKGSVRVEVSNEAGESVAARVTLYDADSVEPLSSGASTDSSPAFFEDIAAVGTSVYVVVEPEDAQYASYNGGEANDVQAISESGETLFQVTLQPSSAIPTTRLEFRVVDEAQNPVSGASLSLYSLPNPLRVVASTTSGDNGEAAFDVSQDAAASVYLTVYASGFLPHVERSVEPGTQQTIALTALVAGNNANARAIVVDDEGALQELARVFLVSADGFYTGLPAQETGADGTTEFSGVPVDGEYGFRATLGSRSGKSDFFVPAVEETINATVVLEPETGVLVVSAADAASGEAIAGAKFSAVLVDSKQTYASCTAGALNSSANASCELRVKAGKQFVVRASADDYAPAESEQLALSSGERSARTLKMVSLRASHELKIIDFSLQPLTAGAPAGDAKQVDKGRVYRALLTVNFPGGADASGAFLRVGDKASAGDDFAVISFFDDDANATITWSSAWGGVEAACSEDLAVQEGSEAKWVNWEYANFFGTRTIAAKVFVKPSARARDKVSVYYRAYSKKKDVVTRTPFDDELGFAEKTAKKDYCRAKTNSRSYAVTEGESRCTDEACINVQFVGEDGTAQGDGFKTRTGSSFEARVAVRSFTGAANSVLRVTAADESLSLRDWSFGGVEGGAGGAGGGRSAQIPLHYDENGEATGTLMVKAMLPSQQAQLKFAVVEESRSVVDVQKFVVVEGLARLTLSVSPQNVSVQTPTALAALVKRADDGSAVEDARVSVREVEDGGWPFDGSPNGDYAIAGDGSEGEGKDGRYVFKRLLATSPGVFEVVAERDGFEPAAAQVAASAADFLEFSRDLSDLRFGCNAVSLEVSSALGLDVPVLASFNGVQCVSLSAPGLVQKDANTWAFTVKKNKATKLELEPLRNGKCYLVFNSVLPASGGASSATAWITVNCSKFEAAPSAVPVTNCTSETCAQCGEKDCLALNDSCEAKYAQTPQGTRVFVKCLQREKPQPKCDASHCELCDEEECNALFATHNCSPLYTTPRRGYEEPVFANCTKFKMPDCSPAKFNFKNILARRLAQYHANLLLNPEYKSQAIGMSAGTQIVYDTAGLRVARTGNGCEQASGTLSVTCDKTINAIVPTNGMAFSIYNQFGSLGADFGAKIKEGKQKCFRLESLDTPKRQPLSKLASLPGDIGAALGLVPPLATHSWEIIFLPTKDCVTYEWKQGEDGIPRLYAKPTADGESVTLLISPFKSEQAAVELTLNIAENEDDEIAKYAFLYTPYNMYAGPDKPSGDATVAAGFFVNNLQAGQKLVLRGVEIDVPDASGKKQSSLFGEDAPLVLQSQQVGVTRVAYKKVPASGDAPESVVLPVSVKSKSDGVEAETPGEVELDPKAYAEDAALKCSDDECCAAEKYSEAKKQVEAEAKSVFSKILGGVEEIYDGNIVDGNAALFKKAFDDAIADYLGQAGAYLVCKNLGIDPLAKLKESCASQAAEPNYLGYENNDLQSQGFGEIYGDSFLETACDSSLLNYAFGTSEAIAPGGTFMDVFKNRLTGALSPRSGTYYKKTYLVPVDIQVHVVLKRKEDAAAKDPKLRKAGIEIYTVRPKDVSSSDSVRASGEWINLEGPKAWTGLKVVQDVIEKGTQPIGVLTGCLAPYFGGTPEEQKPVPDRCNLGKDGVIQVRYDYCVDGVKAEAGAAGGLAGTPEEKCKIRLAGSGEWLGCASAEDCWNYGAYGYAKCFDSLKLLDASIAKKTKLADLAKTANVQLQQGALTPALLASFFTVENGLVKTAGDLFVSKAAYYAFVATAGNKEKPLCYKTYAYSSDGKFDKPPKTGSTQYWICTPLNKLEAPQSCVPLEDVYSIPRWLPTQCSDPSEQTIRCKESLGVPYAYACGSDVTPNPAGTVQEGTVGRHGACVHGSETPSEKCKATDGGRTLSCVQEYKSGNYICAAKRQIEAGNPCKRITNEEGSECVTGYVCSGAKATFETCISEG